jgi:RNA-directed DNA polymerase
MSERKAPRDKRSSDPASEAWNQLPWRKLEKHCFRIQKRIYQASQRGNTRAVHKLQKLLMKSEAARLLAVRRVTQENQGKKTAGVDGVKSVRPQMRLVMASHIHPKQWRHQTPKPVRRVWIPKPGKAEQRPLGIPPMIERCKQALVKLALEPEWEAKFEPNSYGFRPGRSCHDAKEAIFTAINRKPKFVFDADIKGAFDHIKQEALLEKLHTYPTLRKAVKGWLKAGVMEGCSFSPTEVGTPQGGVISPLLMNVALHGMETLISEGYSKSHTVEKPRLIRYADDFVIVHSKLEELQKVSEKVTRWLENLGLTLSSKKTRITHTLTPYQGHVGVDFLGFTIRQFPVGKTQTGKAPQGKPLGFKTYIKPSKEAVKRHMLTIKGQLRKLRSASQEEVIKDLNPIIWGWAAYYKTANSSRTFKRCDHVLWGQLMSWSIARHREKGTRWVVEKYWHRVGTRKWVFATPKNAELRMHSKTHIQRYTKVKGKASPYDGNTLYWSQRLKTHPLMHETKARLLQKQQGKCRWCELHFKDGDTMEIDHLDRNRTHNDLSNKMLLHRHCHDERHAKLAETEKIRKRLADAGIYIQ